MKRRHIVTILALLVALYVLSYLGMSFNGYYNPQVYGLMQGTNGTAVLAPKGFAPYVWNPYTDEPLTTYQEIDGGSLLRLRAAYLLYLPLHQLDRTLWHRDQFFHESPEALHGFGYPVKNYFDCETLTYRDYEPE